MRGIRSHFALLFVAAAVLPLVAYGVISIASLMIGTRRSVVAGNLGVANRAAQHVALYVTTTLKILRAVGADLQNIGLEPWQQERILRNYVLRFPEFQEITLFSESGRPLASSRVSEPGVTIPRTESAFEDIALSPILLDDDLLPTMTAAVRVPHLDGTVDWLVGEFNLLEMWRMLDSIRVGERGYAMILAEDGRLIAHGDPDQKRLVAQGERLDQHPVARLLRAEPAPPSAVAEVQDDRGQTLLVVGTHVPALGWTLFVEQPTAEAYAATRPLISQLFAAIGVALLAMIGLGVYWSRPFLHSIFELRRGTMAIAAGRLDERVRVEGLREFHELGQAFNQMSDRLVELQEDVRKQERQAFFGRIAAGLVHDLSHPIQNVTNSCKLILKMPADEEYRATFRRTVERELGTIKRVLEDLRNLAKPKPLERFPIDVNRSMADVCESMQPQAAIAGVQLEARPAAEPLSIEGDLFALGRTYRNLIINALQATPPGGTVRLSSERAGREVKIRVSDTGCGIPPDRLAVIFDDFTTTKRRGLGLGLAVCKKMVEQMEGRIDVTSEVGKGSTFTLTFVAAPRPAASTPAPPSREMIGI